MTYRGRDMGLPEAGPGSVASLGRRVVAITIDWFSSLVIALVIIGSTDTTDGRVALATLAIFAVQIALLTWLQGASFGQRILGLAVAPVGTARLGLVQVAARTALICVVIPALVIDRNGRGLHDQITRTVVLRRR